MFPSNLIFNAFYHIYRRYALAVKTQPFTLPEADLVSHCEQTIVDLAGLHRSPQWSWDVEDRRYEKWEHMQLDDTLKCFRKAPCKRAFGDHNTFVSNLKADKAVYWIKKIYVKTIKYMLFYVNSLNSSLLNVLYQ